MSAIYDSKTVQETAFEKKNLQHVNDLLMNL